MPEELIHYKLDNEEYTTRHRRRTPDQLMREARPPVNDKTHYLEQVIGSEQISYEGKGHEEIEMKDGMIFVTVLIKGPTNTS